MSDLFWLTEAQLKRIEPYLSKSRGVPRVDDRRVVSGIIHVIRNGLRWRDAPAVYGPNKTLYSRFVLWSRMRIFDRIFPNLAAKNVPPDCLMIEHYSSQSPPHRRQSAQKGGFAPPYRAHEGWLELQTACHHRRRWQADCPASHPRPDERPHGRKAAIPRAA